MIQKGREQLARTEKLKEMVLKNMNKNKEKNKTADEKVLKIEKNQTIEKE